MLGAVMSFHGTFTRLSAVATQTHFAPILFLSADTLGIRTTFCEPAFHIHNAPDGDYLMKFATKLLASAAALALMTASAYAADLYVPVDEPYIPEVSGLDWTGTYIGVHIGGGSLNGDMTAYTPYNSYNGFEVGSLDTTGILGGLQLGFNYQTGTIVLGVEADASLMNLGAISDDNDPGRDFWRDLNWTATIAPRIGIAMDSVLVYAKGGVAFGGFEVGHDQSGTDISAESTEIGFVIGGGVEYALDQNWSMKLEYNYMNFGDARIEVSGSPDIEIKQGGDLHAVKFGLNYRF